MSSSNSIGKVEDRNLIFYSQFPWDKNSKEFISELSKNSGLEKQFRKISIHDPSNPQMINHILPQIIKRSLKEYPQRLPILVAAGFDNFVFGEDATKWIKNNAFNDHGGLKYGDLNQNSSSLITMSCALDGTGNFTEHKMFGDQEFHLLGESSNGVIDLKDQHCLVKDVATHRIDTYADSTNKRNASREIDSKIQQLKSQRDLEFQPAKGPSVPQMPSCTQQNTSGFQYNPDPRMPVGGGIPQTNNNRSVPQVPNFGRMF